MAGLAAEMVASAGAMAAGMVASAGVQEAVSGGVSSVMSSREEKASEKHNMERLEVAHADLAFALQISRRLPIIDSSLHDKRRILKRAYEECSDVVQRCKQQHDQEEQQGATQSQTRSTSSFPRKVIDAVNKRTKYIGSWIGLKGDELRLSLSSVARFEQFAGMADKFVRDVQTGCSLSHYRFLSPLTRLILDMKPLLFEKVQGRRRAALFIVPTFSLSEERGGAVDAWTLFFCGDLVTRKPTKYISLLIRLSDSTDVVGIIAQCIKSLGPVLKPRVEDAIGEIAELTTQSNCWSPDYFSAPIVRVLASKDVHLGDETCCTSIGADDAAATSNGFPPQVLLMGFKCRVPAIEFQLMTTSSIAKRLATSRDDRSVLPSSSLKPAHIFARMWIGWRC